MEKTKLLVSTYDARLSQQKVASKCVRTRVSYKPKMYDEELEQKVEKKMIFEDFVAIEFRRFN